MENASQRVWNPNLKFVYTSCILWLIGKVLLYSVGSSVTLHIVNKLWGRRGFFGFCL